MNAKRNIISWWKINVFRNDITMEAYSSGGIELGKLVCTTNTEYERYKSKCNGDKLLKIVRLETSESYCNKGVATTLMNIFLKQYKDWNIYLLCHPMPRGECDSSHKTVKDLRRFYSKFGFVPCGELIPTMIRKASIY